MFKAHHRIPNALSVLIDLAIITGSMAFAFWMRFSVFRGEGPVMSGLSHVLWGAAFSPVFVFLYSLLGIYGRRSPNSTMRTIGRLVLCNTVAMMLYIDFIYLFRVVDFSRWLLVIAWATINVLTCCKAVLIDNLQRLQYERGIGRTRVVVVGSSFTARTYAKAVNHEYPRSFTLMGSVGRETLMPGIALLGSYADVGHILEELVPDEVVVALDSSEQRHLDDVLLACENAGIRVELLPTYHQFLSSRPHISQQAGLPLISVNRITLDNMGLAFLKRAFDVLGSLVLIVLTSPIMLVAALGTKLSSPGPVIFRQERVGRGRRPFYILKFRSMRLNAQSDSAWTTGDDPRRTAFGSFMRRYSIDELPQLFNVLKGDMSLVGPRPEIPQYVNRFKHSVPLYMVRHQVRPGMTGWAQVNGLRGDTSIEKRIEYDLFYIENWSLMFDIRILLMTPFKGIVNKQETLEGHSGGHRPTNEPTDDRSRARATEGRHFQKRR